MYNNIERLINETRGIELKVFPAYIIKDRVQENTIGIRDKDNHGININGTWWCIAADAFNGSKKLNSINELMSASNPHISLEASTSVCGAIITVHLGAKSIVSRTITDDNTVIIKII